jgi:integrase/recombinase XerD
MASAHLPLREYLDNARAALQNDGSPDMLFLNHRGKKLTRQGVWLILKEAAEAAGIDAEVTPRTLRHSFAKHLVGSGENLRRVQKLLGHANLSTTQVYRQPGPAPETEAPAEPAP